MKDSLLAVPNDPKQRPVEEAERVVFESLTRPKTNDG